MVQTLSIVATVVLHLKVISVIRNYASKQHLFVNEARFLAAMQLMWACGSTASEHFFVCLKLIQSLKSQNTLNCHYFCQVSSLYAS